MTSSPKRPTPREIFLTKDRQLQVFFHTSNISKYLQARAVFERAGLILQHFRATTDPYLEDYGGTKRQLLVRAVKEIAGRVGTGSLFFVEDTSVRIEALSDGDNDVPGVAVKEWFASTTFETVDQLLRERGNDRRATVKSDIALHVPGLGFPVFFEGSISGVIAASPPQFEEDAKHPWLTPNTFNGWLIPEGADKRLGEMLFEESWYYDFRIRALEKLLTRLEEYTGILNLHPQGYVRKVHPSITTQFQLFTGPVLLIVGPTCAGKTTFGEWAKEQHDATHIEASAVLRMIRREQSEEDGDAFAFAHAFLSQNGPDIIARKIVQVYAGKFDKGVVITGFRTIEELEYIRDLYPWAKVILVDASERTRFQRQLVRGRTPDCATMDDFRKVDDQQFLFGLLRVAEYLADVRVENEGTIADYHQQIDAVFAGTDALVSGIFTSAEALSETAERTQFFRCLRALDSAGRPLSCDEIEKLTVRTGARIRHNNANKVLKRAPELARRIESEGTRVRYEIQNPGRAYLRYVSKTHDMK